MLKEKKKKKKRKILHVLKDGKANLDKVEGRQRLGSFH